VKFAIIKTQDGRKLNGDLLRETEHGVTIRVTAGEISIHRDNIKSLKIKNY
jgi:hypothetical protein